MMDRWLADHRCARMLSTALPLLFEASEYARESGRAELVTQLEHLAEEIVNLHRQVLDLPAQRSTSLQDREEDVPW